MSDRLVSGQSLRPGQEIDAAGQPVRCIMQTDGNLVVYWGQSNFPLWATGTNGQPVTQAIMQTDGNFVLYAGAAAIWGTGTNGHPGASLVVQPDGELVVLDGANSTIWRSGSVIVTAPPRASSILPSGGALTADQFLQAPRQPYTCVMQADGNLVVYKLGAQAIWASGTNGTGVAYAVMQGDGNLVLYAASHFPSWESGTAGNPGAHLVMQDDGNLVIYAQDWRPLWASNTMQPPQPKHWAIVLCKFEDIAAEPQPPGWYADYYSNPAVGGAAAYWQTVTDGVIDLSSSEIFGWFTMNHSTVELKTMTFPSERWKLAQWGRDTAQAHGVDLAPFEHVLTVMNYSSDGGAVGIPGDVVIGHGDAQYTDLGFVCHEMGHGFGLVHSRAANPDQEYGNGFDLMSFNTTTFDFPEVVGGVIGMATVGLNAHNLRQLGAGLPVASTDATPDYVSIAMLNALTQSPRIMNGAFLAIEIQQADGSYFLVEARKKAQWDHAIPADNVMLVNQIRSDGRSYLVPHAGAYFTVGQMFVAPNPEVFVYARSWRGDQVEIWWWDLPDGALRRELGDARVYQLKGGHKRWVVDPATLSQIEQNTGRMVRPVPAGGLASVPTGPNIALLNVLVSPCPPRLNVPVRVTVTATDPVTGAAVVGEVLINGVKVGTTGVSFTYTFHKPRVIGPVESEPPAVPPGPPRPPRPMPPPPPVYVYPVGSVVAAGYLTTPIDFGFVDV